MGARSGRDGTDGIDSVLNSPVPSELDASTMIRIVSGPELADISRRDKIARSRLSDIRSAIEAEAKGAIEEDHVLKGKGKGKGKGVSSTTGSSSTSSSNSRSTSSSNSNNIVVDVTGFSDNCGQRIGLTDEGFDKQIMSINKSQGRGGLRARAAKEIINKRAQAVPGSRYTDIKVGTTPNSNSNSHADPDPNPYPNPNLNPNLNPNRWAHCISQSSVLTHTRRI